MIEVHHLKANDYITESWQPIEIFPRDGRTVEVQTIKGDVYRAAWQHHRIILDADDAAPLAAWRPLE
jgi:hypothetical protein